MRYISSPCMDISCFLRRAIYLFFIIFGMVVTCVLHFSVSSAQQYPFTLDFEKGDLRGWSAHGEAFHYQPTLGDNPRARDAAKTSRHQEKYWIGTYEKYQGRPGQRPGESQGDRPVGTLRSATFTIPDASLSFLIGGGKSFETRVELYIIDSIEGSIRVFYATGNDTETMQRKSWDLKQYKGKKGYIRIVDEATGRWGHINVDDFIFRPHILIGVINPNVHVFQPPVLITVKVPSVRGFSLSDAEAKLRRLNLKPKNKGPVVSDLPTGVVAKQLPAKGATVISGSTVTIWTSKERETLTVKIRPEYLEVTQGEEAVFESRISSVDETTQVRWYGLAPRPGIEKNLAVHSSGLEPKSYNITLRVYDRHGRREEAHATLVVKARPQVSYSLMIRSNHNAVEEGGPIRFAATLRPYFSRAEFRFNYGDGDFSAWSRAVASEHIYPRAGNYKAFVSARRGGQTIAKSTKVLVTVTRTPSEITVHLKANKGHSRPNEPITFHAELNRRLPEARFRFDFGDFQKSGWNAEPVITHSYKKEGVYPVSVVVQWRSGKSQKSQPVAMRVEAPPQINYGVRLVPDKTSITTGEDVTFDALLKPFARNIVYAFQFGDENESILLKSKGVVHRYSKPGRYAAKVAVKRDGQTIAESIPVGIVVKAAARPINNPAADGNKSVAAKTLWITVFLVATILIVITGYTLNRKAEKPKEKLEMRGARFKAEPHQGERKQSLSTAQPLELKYELQIIHSIDKGLQKIISDGPLTAREKNGEDREHDD